MMACRLNRDFPPMMASKFRRLAFGMIVGVVPPQMPEQPQWRIWMRTGKNNISRVKNNL